MSKNLSLLKAGEASNVGNTSIEKSINIIISQECIGEKCFETGF